MTPAHALAHAEASLAFPQKFSVSTKPSEPRSTDISAWLGGVPRNSATPQSISGGMTQGPVGTFGGDTGGINCPNLSRNHGLAPWAGYVDRTGGTQFHTDGRERVIID